MEKGGLYVGVSAGSILLGPDIDVSSLGDKNKFGVKDFTGLALVDVAISPHANEKDEQAKIAAFQKKVDYKVLPLTDSQALLVLNETQKVIQ